MTGTAFRDGQLESPAPGGVSPEPTCSVAHPPRGQSEGPQLRRRGKGAPQAARALQSRMPLFIPPPRGGSPIPHRTLDTKVQTLPGGVGKHCPGPAPGQPVPGGATPGDPHLGGLHVPTCAWGPAPGACAWGPAAGGLQLGACTWGPAPRGPVQGAKHWGQGQSSLPKLTPDASKVPKLSKHLSLLQE